MLRAAQPAVDEYDGPAGALVDVAEVDPVGGEDQLPRRTITIRDWVITFSAVQLGALDLTSGAGDDVGTDLNRSNRVESQVQPGRSTA